MPPDLRARAAELGLDPADLLQHTRCILLVEGQHELIILDELLGDEFDRLGIEMLCMRGAKALKTWDAQILERFTDVPIVVLVDNDQADRLRGIWERAKDAAASGEVQSALEIVDEMKSGGRGSEGEFLRELCKELLQRDDTERYHITAFDKPDIPEYLRPVDIATAVGPDATWDTLRKRAGATNFKNWMKKQYRADYSDESLQAAASKLDEIPADFVDLLQELATLTRSGAAPTGG